MSRLGIHYAHPTRATTHAPHAAHVKNGRLGVFGVSETFLQNTLNHKEISKKHTPNHTELSKTLPTTQKFLQTHSQPHKNF